MNHSFTCPSMKDDRNLPLESIKERYSNERNMSVAKLDVLIESELKSRILSAESTLSCTSQEPLHFVVVSLLEFDETFNLSIKSVDYDGDSEASLDSESEFDESFCVGRNRLSSYHSVEEFSDDETTMDAGAHFNQRRPKENFTPIFHGSKTENNVFFEHKDIQSASNACVGQGNSKRRSTSFAKVFGNVIKEESHEIPIPIQNDVEGPSCSSAAPAPCPARKRTVSDDRGKQRVLKRKQKIPSLRSAPVGKRTRSNSLHK